MMNSQVTKVSLGFFGMIFKSSFCMGDTAHINNNYLYLGVVQINSNERIWGKIIRDQKSLQFNRNC